MNKIIELIEQGDYQRAEKALSEYMNEHPFSDDVAVLGATIAQGLGKYDEMLECVRLGLSYNPDHYELYYMLGEYYRMSNEKLAYLYFELAVEKCNQDADRAFLEEAFETFARESGVEVPGITILYLTHDSEPYIDISMKALRNFVNEKQVEIIAVDNGSKDRSVQILRQYSNVQVLQNTQPVGIARCINEGIKKSNPNNDIYLMQAEYVPLKNSVQMLRLDAYEKALTGATGSVSNHFVNHQCKEVFYNEFEKALEEEKKNIPTKNYCEVKTYLAPFSLFIKRQAIDKVGLFDETLNPAEHVDEDYGIRILEAGYQNYLCYNSYVYCLLDSERKSVIEDWRYAPGSYRSFKEKWGFTSAYFSGCRVDLMTMIERDREEELHFLEVGCTSGETLSRLQYRYPNGSVHGVELNEQVAAIGAYKLDIHCGNIETMQLPYGKESFDYIIFGDVLEHLAYPEDTLIRMREYLKEDGCILTSIPNILYGDVIYDLLQGNFTYQDYGILDRTHLRFFTQNEIFKMFSRCGYYIDQLSTTKTSQNPSERHPEFFKQLFEIRDIGIDKTQIDIFQFLVRARKQ
ncbi:MAG: methyltransferase domain-containing protein [Eubacterium sp.]|nr:methyltransferase domain-containing protein [Eubacterium sp.]